MNSFQVEGQSPAEVARLQDAQDEVSGALNAYFQAVIAQRQAPPFDTAVYAEMLNNLVSATLQQCFAVEQGVREEFYREGVIEFIERLFFGPPLVAGQSGE
jgi:hypothetical protein